MATGRVPAVRSTRNVLGIGTALAEGRRSLHVLRGIKERHFSPIVGLISASGWGQCLQPMVGLGHVVGLSSEQVVG